MPTRQAVLRAGCTTFSHEDCATSVGSQKRRYPFLRETRRARSACRAKDALPKERMQTSLCLTRRQPRWSTSSPGGEFSCRAATKRLTPHPKHLQEFDGELWAHTNHEVS